MFFPFAILKLLKHACLFRIVFVLRIKAVCEVYAGRFDYPFSNVDPPKFVPIIWLIQTGLSGTTMVLLARAPLVVHGPSPSMGTQIIIRVGRSKHQAGGLFVNILTNNQVNRELSTDLWTEWELF